MVILQHTQEEDRIAFREVLAALGIHAGDVYPYLLPVLVLSAKVDPGAHREVLPVLLALKELDRIVLDDPPSPT